MPDTPQNRQLDAATMARGLAAYTIQICTNKNVFLPQYQSALTDDIIRTVKDIYADVWMANNIRVDEKGNGWKQRCDLQKKAILNCYSLLAQISLARELFHLRGKRVEYWSEKTIEVRKKIKSWHEGDRKRFEKLIK